MGSRIDIRTVDTWVAGKQDWLKTRKGFDTCRSITLDMSTFTYADHAPNGFIPSGTVLGKITATGLYGPYDPDGGDGREVAEFLLFEDTIMESGQTKDVSAAGLWEGVVSEAKLPVPANANVDGKIDANAKTDLKFIRFEA
jgi:Bacteriophage lambda head decoration protein D